MSRRPSSFKTGLRCSTITFILPPSVASLSTTRYKFVVSSPHTTYSNDMGIPGGFGCTLITGLISAMLYGITVLQTYVYYMTHCSEDTSTVRLLVAATCILDTLHVSFMCHTLYHYLITNYGVPTSLNYIVWSYPASAAVNLLVVVMVQLFFTHKIHCLCRRGVRWLVTAPILLFVFAHYGFGMVVTVLTLFNTRMSIITQTWYYSVTPSAATVSVAEVLITVSLCVLLYDGGFYSSCPRAKRLINTLITYATNRCLLTLLVVISELAVNVDQQAFWTMGLNFIVGKLYTNSLLASLNAREHLRSQGSSTISILNISALHFADPQTLPRDGRNSTYKGRRFEVPGVDITTEAGL
ncbi:hypothetical protein PISMIDRAFT_674009 [Pisolithus microcarpus 441]|uniref:DUF6534 domain-containing protein n=1 Tax=Pisolithus microcarpus 441 TaxID=765257 RepID=A0A0C9ZG58_9AGAM|nr:hypothetical protein PISMIDRAFT_674009 [Pisolithus microcarpus 441]